MAIERVKINNFLVFSGNFECGFQSGMNVIIGGNGTGKTTLMKVLYAAVKKDSQNKTINRSLSSYFRSKDKNDLLNVTGSAYSNSVKFSKKGKYDITVEGTGMSNLSATYIPITEMLSYSEGMISHYTRSEIPFDLTEIDILLDAQKSVTRELTANAKKLLNKLTETIGGEVLCESDSFYIKTEKGNVPFSLEASGFQKLGLLWKLLRNGLLEKDSVLFWDEPEASINADHIPMLADILLELGRNVVQVFIASHDYLLPQFIEARKQGDDKLSFLSLYKTEASRIEAESNESFKLLKHNNIIEQSIRLYEEEVEAAF